MGWGGVGGGVRADVLWRRRRGRRQDVPVLVSGKGRCRADTHNTVPPLSPPLLLMLMPFFAWGLNALARSFIHTRARARAHTYTDTK